MTKVLDREAKPRPPRSPKVTPPKITAETSPGLQAIAELHQNYSYAKIQEEAAAGKSVIWGGFSWESPLIYACDVKPVGFDQLWYDNSRESEAIAEDHFQIPGEFCSMIKTMVGRLHADRNNNIKRILHFGSGCEPIQSVFELSKADGYEVQTIESVSAFRTEEKRPAAIALLVSELRRIGVWLTGKPVDEDRVADEIRRKNRLLRKVHKLLDLRGKHPLYIPGIQTLLIFMGSMHGYGNPEKFGEALDLLIAELEALEVKPLDHAYIPLVVAGGVGNRRLLQAIEESNGAIVSWVLGGDLLYNEDLPPLEALAHYVLDAQGRGDLGEMVGASVAYRRFRVEDEVRRTGARGIISSSIVGCPYASLMQQFERDHFKNNSIPLLALETDVHREPPTEEQIMRVKAFIEMLS
jgi:benzoyl-CoA reductase/2-hydroxyglutaryl-CoA dehydratase subunit BcrC/BadD/HgdB